MIEIVHHAAGQRRAVVVWYWAKDGYSPSDSCRMFWY